MSSIEEIFKKYHKKIAPLDLELILENALKKPRFFIIAHPEFRLNKSQMLNVKYQMSRRLKGEPLAYVLGHKEFYGLDFKVNKNVLVPRPETELLVEEALNHITHNTKHVTFIDVGTGSGCIIITLAKLLDSSKLQVISYKLIGIDILKEALNIAKHNAKLHKVGQKIKFINGNLLEPILKSKILNQKSKIIILANLPYLTPAQIKKSPTIQHEPKLALSAGPDGLKYYRHLFKQIKKMLSHVTCHLSLVLEIDPSQAKKIKQLVKKELPTLAIRLKKDLRGHNRLVIITQIAE